MKSSGDAMNALASNLISPAREHRRAREGAEEERRRRREQALEWGLEQTFPASDAVAVVQPRPPVDDD